MFRYIRIGNHVRVKSSGVTPGQGNARPPNHAKFVNGTSPGLTWKANAPQYGRGGGGGEEGWAKEDAVARCEERK